MKLADLVHYLTACGCSLIGEGGMPVIRKRPAKGKVSSISRHREIKDPTPWAICRQLGIPKL